MNELANFAGIRIVACEYLPTTRRAQVRFPRSKKKRIQKKWRKNSRNWGEIDATKDVYLIPDPTNIGWESGPMYMMHPDGIKELAKKCSVIRNIR